MDVINLIKIITTLITSGVSLVVGTRILILNRTDWLNRWFALFLYSSASGFLIYAIYHLILDNPTVIVPLMVTSHIFFNFLMVSLTMTVFVLEKYTKIAMSMKYLGTMLIIFFIMSLGYFIFIPTLDMDRYNLGIVDTSTPLGWLITVNVIRVILGVYVVSRYIGTTKKMEGDTRNRIKWFSYGVIMAVLGMIINLAGGAFSQLLIEIIALIFVSIGAILIFKGFLI
ncbi:MAG: hypothetical protein JSV62_06240 [Promethearchaeota archaeon]|nr:MAG: hypothetical protein JSV62_06240 [Candidatus Lokiarchaeota archaeon]